MKEITVEQLKKRLDNGEKINLIDCREPNEYAENNIGGKLVPLSVLQKGDLSGVSGLENQEVIIHCRSGMRSATACRILESNGFTNTVNLQGGIMAWLNAYSEN